MTVTSQKNSRESVHSNEGSEARKEKRERKISGGESEALWALADVLLPSYANSVAPSISSRHNDLKIVQ